MTDIASFTYTTAMSFYGIKKNERISFAYFCCPDQTINAVDKSKIKNNIK